MSLTSKFCFLGILYPHHTLLTFLPFDRCCSLFGSLFWRFISGFFLSVFRICSSVLYFSGVSKSNWQQYHEVFRKIETFLIMYVWKCYEGNLEDSRRSSQCCRQIQVCKNVNYLEGNPWERVSTVSFLWNKALCLLNAFIPQILIIFFILCLKFIPCSPFLLSLKIQDFASNWFSWLLSLLNQSMLCFSPRMNFLKCKSDRSFFYS